MSKARYYKSYIDLMLTKPVPVEIVGAHLTSDDGEAALLLQDCINLHIRKELDWATGIGIMDSADLMYQMAIETEI